MFLYEPRPRVGMSAGYRDRAPSSILRAPDAASRAAARQQFVADLKKIAKWL